MANKGRPLEWNLRERIKALVADGNSRREIARDLRLSRNTVAKYAGAKAKPTSD